MDTMKAVRVDVCGAAEQMSVKEVPLPQPGAGEVRVKLKACGINLIDTYHRSGLYPWLCQQDWDARAQVSLMRWVRALMT